MALFSSGLVAIAIAVLSSPAVSAAVRFEGICTNLIYPRKARIGRAGSPAERAKASRSSIGAGVGQPLRALSADRWISALGSCNACRTTGKASEFPAADITSNRDIRTLASLASRYALMTPVTRSEEHTSELQ